jgi:hypothetical protein
VKSHLFFWVECKLPTWTFHRNYSWSRSRANSSRLKVRRGWDRASLIYKGRVDNWCLVNCTISFNSYLTRHRPKIYENFRTCHGSPRASSNMRKRSHKIAQNCLQKFIFRPRGAYGKWGRGICKMFAVLARAEVNKVYSYFHLPFSLNPPHLWLFKSVVLQNWQRWVCSSKSTQRFLLIICEEVLLLCGPSTKNCHACPGPSTKSKVRFFFVTGHSAQRIDRNSTQKIPILEGKDCSVGLQWQLYPEQRTGTLQVSGTILI